MAPRALTFTLAPAAFTAGKVDINLESTLGWTLTGTHLLLLERMLHEVASGQTYLFMVTSEDASQYAFGNYATVTGQPIAIFRASEASPTYVNEYAPVLKQTTGTLTLYCYTSTNGGATWTPVTSASSTLFTAVTFQFGAI